MYINIISKHKCYLFYSLTLTRTAEESDFRGTVVNRHEIV